MIPVVSVFGVALVLHSGATVWVVRLLAQRLKIDKADWRAVTMAVVSASVIGLLVGVTMTVTLDLSPWLALPPYLLVAFGIYAWLLRPSPVHALLMGAASGLVAALFLLLALLTMSALGLDKRPGAEQSLADGEPIVTIEQAANRVCDCGNDQQCLRQRYAEVIFMSTQTENDLSQSDPTHHLELARRCVNLGKRGVLGPGSQQPSPAATAAPAEASASSAPGETSDAEPAVETAVAAATTTPAGASARPPVPGSSIIPDNVYGQRTSQTPSQRRAAREQYRPIAIAQANAYAHHQARITRRDNGKVVEGKLAPVARYDRDHYVAISLSRYGGTAIIQIPIQAVRKIEVRVAR